MNVSDYELSCLKEVVKGQFSTGKKRLFIKIKIGCKNINFDDIFSEGSQNELLQLSHLIMVILAHFNKVKTLYFNPFKLLPYI